MVAESKTTASKTFLGHIYTPVEKGSNLDLPEGFLSVDENGKISAVGKRKDFLPGADEQVVDLGKSLLLPGFVDMHIHLPQVAQTGRSGEHLLAWLEKYIFPAEMKFEDVDFAEKLSYWFFDELLRNGTTTACVFTTIHKTSCDRAFSVAEKVGNRVIMGKVLMDENCPDSLKESHQQSIEESLALFEKWHDRDNGRLKYAFTPRFAVTSSRELLKGVGEAWAASAGSYLHTHLAESRGEVDLVRELFPEARSYVDVYKMNGLFGTNTVFAHSIHLDDNDLAELKRHDCSLAHCPSSNFFLKSGIFAFERIKESGIRFGLGSDVAAGPEMSMFQVMKDANYIQPSHWLTPADLFYRATLGGARALGLSQQIGSLEAGKDADFIIVDPTNRNAIANDMLEKETEDILSSLVFLGDDRCVEATYIRGREVFSKKNFSKAY
ncbi:MAG: guanine deaminase [Candidatus Obscuribacterales bacterium]|nr:guanine deaminase [Candidatus Obscuribacterales bacterium]